MALILNSTLIGPTRFDMGNSSYKTNTLVVPAYMRCNEVSPMWYLNAIYVLPYLRQYTVWSIQDMQDKK